MNISELTTQEIILQFGGDSKNSGKSSVQIAILTKDILLLSEHIKVNKKDLHSLRGLKMKVNQRTFLLKYLKRTDITEYENIKSQLNIRR